MGSSMTVRPLAGCHCTCTLINWSVLRHPYTKDQAEMAPLGCGRTPSAPVPLLERLGPIFGEAVPLMMLMMVRVGFPPNIPCKPPIGGWFGAFHVEMKHLSKTPLLSTYKGRLPPPHLNIRQERKSTKEQEQEHHSMGLGPS